MKKEEKLWEKMTTEQFEQVDDIVWKSFFQITETLGISTDFITDDAGAFLSALIDTRSSMLETIQELKGDE